MLLTIYGSVSVAKFYLLHDGADDYLRLAGGICKQPTKSCITFQLDKNKDPHYRCTLYTQNYTIESEKRTLNSGSDGNFFEDAVLNKMIIPADKDRRWLETQYVSREFK